MSRHVIIPLFIPHVGCPHDCIFCDQAKITGQGRETGGMISGEDVLATIAQYLETIDRAQATVEVSFFGGTFTGIDGRKQTELLEAAQKAKNAGLVDCIRLSTRPDYISIPILDRLKRYGVDIVELGVQSFDEEVLQRSQRGYPPETVRRASALITRFGFTLGHQLMVGLPGDTAEKDLQSVRESIALHPKLIRIYPALILRGTAMEELYQKGEYAPYDLEEAVKICAQMLDAYEEAGIPVIRMGLQPTEEINENAQVLAGPFHPAFRELVESYRLCRRVETFGERAVTLTVGKRDLSKLYAGKKRYFAPLAEKLAIEVKVVDASLPQIIHLERREDRSVL